MEPEVIVLRELRVTGQRLYDPTHRGSLEESNPETESGMVVPGWGGGRGVVYNWHKVSVWEDEKVLEMEVMTAQQCERT